MRHLALLADELVQWADREPRVEAVLWYGSTARGEAGPTSDLDSVVLHNDDSEAFEMVGSLRAHFGQRLSFYSFARDSNAASMWIDSQLTKIDLHFGSDPEDFAWLADSADVPVPRLVIGYDPHSRCDQIVKRANTRLGRSASDLLNVEVEKFVCAFEAASAAHRRSDGYQFYFHYNLALHRLARIVELVRGDSVYMFLPKLLLPKRMPLDEQVLWRDLRGTMYLPDANDLKRRLLEHFLRALEDAHARHMIERRRDDVEVFLQSVLRRDLFYNVRDFADAFEGRVRQGVLFRASTLTRWSTEPALGDWLRGNRIRMIIDLRKVEERERATGSYSEELLAGIEYVQLPMGGPASPPDLPPSSPEMGEAYVRMFSAECSTIVLTLSALARVDAGAAVVHCHAGKDRTGVVCAALASILDLPQDLIEADYLLSGQGVVREAIGRFLAATGGVQGVRAALLKAGLTATECQGLRERFLVTPP